MGHSQFKFKSSGTRSSSRQYTKAPPSAERPIGMKTPLEEGDDIFKMHTSPVRQLSDNFRNLIMTNHGERLGLFNFGANLNSIVFEYSSSPDFEKIISDSIINATQMSIPSITITDISTMFIDQTEINDANRVGLAKVRVKVEYLIPKFKSPKLALEVDLSLGG